MTDKKMIERFAQKQCLRHYLCPRCGRDAMDETPTRNALSRNAAVYVCDTCGTAEALWIFSRREPEPLAAWAISMWPGKYGMVESNGEAIVIPEHYGTWYVIDEGVFSLPTAQHTETLFLLEHEEHGDEADDLIVNASGVIILDDVWNGFDDLLEAGWEQEH